jgi:signal transduction histidine kinase
MVQSNFGDRLQPALDQAARSVFNLSIGETGSDGPSQTVGSAFARSEDGVVMGAIELPLGAVTHPERGWPMRHRQAPGIEVLRAELVAALRGRQHLQRLMITAGHDLIQPLQVIQILLARHARPATPAEVVEWTQAVRDEICRAADGLHDLARSAFLGAESFAPEARPVRASELMEAAMARWRHHIARKGLPVRCVPSQAAVVTDPTLLATVLDNLIGNALKHTDRGGILFGCRRRGDHLAMEVVDTGPGIAQADLTRMFEPFERSSTHAGLGLGLAIVRSTAALLGHEVQVETAPGSGSRFSILLPRALDADAVALD